MATEITFTSNGPGNPSITVESASHPDKPGVETAQTFERLEGGGLDIIMPAGEQSEEAPELRFIGYPDADKNTLINFFQNTINWREYSFTYTDHHGTDHTNMVYIEGIGTFETQPEVFPEIWNGVIKIEKDPTL